MNPYSLSDSSSPPQPVPIGSGARSSSGQRGTVYTLLAIVVSILAGGPLPDHSLATYGMLTGAVVLVDTRRIDRLAVTEDSVHLIDFKTDRPDAERLAIYRHQVRGYASAIAAATGSTTCVA